MTSSIEVTVKETEPRTLAYLSMKGPYSQIGETFNRLYATIVEKGLVPAGPPVGFYYNTPGQVPDEQLYWELCSPVAGEVSVGGPDEKGFGIKQLEPVQVAATIHKGSFENVGDTYGALAGWIAENGYQVNGPGEEVYLSDPGTTPPEELTTEVRFPVVKI